MFKTDEVGKIAAHAVDVINVLDGLTVGEAQMVLKQAENVILGAQRVVSCSINPMHAAEVVKAHLLV
jgi:hypothetical protein